MTISYSDAAGNKGTLTLPVTLAAVAPPGPMPQPPNTTTKIASDYFSGKALSGLWLPNMGDAQYGVWQNTPGGNTSKKLPNPYSGMNSGNTNLEYYDPARVVVDGQLTITAALNAQFAAQGYSWGSGCIRTVNQGQVPSTGAVIQMRAKQPDSRYGAWAGTPWFLNGSAELDGNEGGYTGLGAPNNTLAANSHVNSSLQKLVNAGVDLSAGFHDYRVTYKPGVSCTWQLDEGTPYYTLSGANVPTGAMEAIINLQIAAPMCSGWHTITSTAQPGPFVLTVTAFEIWV